MSVSPLPTKAVWIDSKTKKLNVNIWPKQKEFISSDAIDEIFYGGSAGGGKTEAILHFCLKRRMQYPGTRGVIFRRKFPDLERTLIPRSHEFFLKVGAKYNGSKHVWKFPNGSIQEFAFCENENDVYSYQSAEYHDMCFDEASHFTYFQFSYLTSRCRSAKEGVKPLIRLASNPGGVGHGWLKKRFVDPGKVQKKWYLTEEQKSLAFIPARLEDNPSLRLADPTYENRLKILGDKKYRALRFGDWDVFEGQFFSEWSKDHVLQYNRQPDTYSRKVLCMDWGFASPACVLWLEVTPSGRVYVYRELYVTRLAPKELAEAVCNCSPKEERYSALYAPPEIWGKEVELEGGGQPIQRLMQTVFNKLRPDILMQKSNNARVPGWQKVREYLRMAPDGFPWMQISPCCTNLIETLPEMIHDEKRPEDLDTEASDHACVTGDTVVETRKGFEKIKDLVGTEGEVWSQGGWRRYRNVCMTRKNVDVYAFKIGARFLECTLDHCILTHTGKEELGKLTSNHVLIDIGASSLIRSVTWTLKLFQVRCRNLMENVIILVDGIFKDEENGYTEWCGNFMREKFQKAFMSTTLTITNLTMPEKIWSVYLNSHTYPTMLRLRKQYVAQEKWLKSTDISQRRGIGLQRAESGTENTGLKLGRIKGGLIKTVCFVANSIKRLFHHVLNFVILIVKWLFLEEKMRFDFVPMIKSVGKKDVYNMYVEDVNCYAVNGGLLIANCDALRYGLVSLQTIPKISLNPYGVQTIDKIFGEEGEFEAMSRPAVMPGRGGY